MPNQRQNKGRGRILIFTGDGRGKTTAALGTALRAAGHGMRVLLVQFVKSRECGEHAAARMLEPYLEIALGGTGFLREDDPDSLQQAAEKARQTLQLARASLAGGAYQLVILDEVLFAVSKGLLRSDEVRAALQEKHPQVHVILTGRGCAEEFADMADTITEMKNLKHAMEAGVKATRGIEF